MTKPAIYIFFVEYLREDGRKKPKRLDLPRLRVWLYLITVQSVVVEKAKTHEVLYRQWK